MTSLLPAITGGIVRALMAFAAGYGVELGNDQAEQLVQGALVVGTVAWTVVEKWLAARRVEKAAITGRTS